MFTFCGILLSFILWLQIIQSTKSLTVFFNFVEIFIACFNCFTIFFYWYWAKKLRFQGARVSWFRTWYNFYLCANPYNMIDTHYVLHVQIDMMAIINDPLLSKFDLYPLSFVYLRPKVLFSLSGQFCYLPTLINSNE